MTKHPLPEKIEIVIRPNGLIEVMDMTLKSYIPIGIFSTIEELTRFIMCAHNTPEEIHEYIHKGSVRNARQYSSNNTTNTEECDNVALIPVGRHVCDASYAWPSGIKNYIEEQVIHYDMIAPMSIYDSFSHEMWTSEPYMKYLIHDIFLNEDRNTTTRAFIGRFIRDRTTITDPDIAINYEDRTVLIDETFTFTFEDPSYNTNMNKFCNYVLRFICATTKEFDFTTYSEEDAEDDFPTYILSVDEQQQLLERMYPMTMYPNGIDDGDNSEDESNDDDDESDENYGGSSDNVCISIEDDPDYINVIGTSVNQEESTDV